MSSNGDEKPYAVGYGKPPRHSRFQKGRSGNPRGRPKRPATVDIGEALAKILKQRVVIREGGVERSVPRLEVALRQLANKAAAGDMKAITVTLNLARALGLTPAHAGLVEGRDYGVLVVPQPCTSVEEYDRLYGPVLAGTGATEN